MRNIKDINQLPTIIDNNHESILRSYQILELVKEMIKRWDSIETMWEIIEQCEHEELKVTGWQTFDINPINTNRHSGHAGDDILMNNNPWKKLNYKFDDQWECMWYNTVDESTGDLIFHDLKNK